MKKLLLIPILCLLIFFSVDFYLKTDKVQVLIQQKLETVLKHKTEFSIATLKFKGLTIHNLKVYKKNNELLFKAEKVSITFNLYKLFHKDQYKNFLLLITNIYLKEVEYSFTKDLKLTEAKINIKNFSQIKLVAKINNYSIYTEVILNAVKDLEINKLTISAENLEATNTNKGFLKIIDTNNFELNIDLLLKTLKIEKFLKHYLKGEATTTCNLKIHNLDNISASGNLDLTKTVITYKNLKKETAITCNLDYQISYSSAPFKINIDSAVLNIFKNKILLKGYFAKSIYDLNIKSNNFDITNINLLTKTKNFKKGNINLDAYLNKLKKSVFLSSPFVNFEMYGCQIIGNLNCNFDNNSGKINLESLLYKNLIFKNLQTNFNINDNLISLTKLQSVFQNGFVAGSANFNNLEKVYEADITLKNVELNNLCNTFELQTYNVTGKAKGTLKITGKLSKPKLTDFIIDADLVANNGEFQNITLFNKFGEKFNNKNLSTITYETARLETKLKDGLLNILEFKTNTNELGTILLKGDINFLNQELDLSLDFDRTQKTALIKKLIIKGTFKKPKYELVLGDVIKNLGETILITTPTAITKTVLVDTPMFVVKNILGIPKFLKKIIHTDKD